MQVGVLRWEIWPEKEISVSILISIHAVATVLAINDTVLSHLCTWAVLCARALAETLVLSVILRVVLPPIPPPPPSRIFSFQSRAPAGEAPGSPHAPEIGFHGFLFPPHTNLRGGLSLSRFPPPTLISV